MFDYDLLAGDIVCDIHHKVRLVFSDGGNQYVNDTTGTLRDEMIDKFTKAGIVFEKILLHTLYIHSIPEVV